ncbi:MAG: helix-turn-helix domain-containing protein [Acidobacteria bacterium]|nr:helix-turn-helix domain-containing protein [Acidobacteriota bacterium]
MIQPGGEDHGIWCPLCNRKTRLLRVSNAAKMLDVHSRTIYRYIEEGLVHAIKIVGKTYRVCGSCLLKAEGSKNKE